MAHRNIDPEAFKAAWLAVHRRDGTLAEVAAALGLSKGSAATFASRLRDRGVVLPLFKVGYPSGRPRPPRAKERA